MTIDSGFTEEAKDEGGDAPCWAHLLDDETGVGLCAGGQASDLGAIAASLPQSGTAWTLKSDDLNANLLVLNEGGRSAEHVNDALDVLIIGISGRGVVTIDGVASELGAAFAILAPKGSTQSIRATGGPVAYLTCHRQRGGLWPSPSGEPGGDQRVKS